VAGLRFHAKTCGTVAQAATISIPDEDAAAIGGDEGARWESGRSLGEEDQPMMKAFAAGLLGMMLCLVAPNPAAAEDQALTEDEVRELFEGNTEVGEGRKGDIDTGRRWTAFYAADNSTRKRESASDIEGGGTWFVDKEGRHCFRWEGKERTKCDLIVRDGDHYLRIRDGQVRGRIRIEEGNTSNL
jgi:hypothetical protein